MTGTYCFCELHKPVTDGVLQMLSWIPSTHAVVGKILRLKDPEAGHWSDGWRVESTSDPRPAKQVETYAQMSHRARRTFK